MRKAERKDLKDKKQDIIFNAMTELEEAIRNYKEYYKEAVAMFNSTKYKLFLSNIRIAEEWLARAIVQNMLSGDSTINVQDVFDGKENGYLGLKAARVPHPICNAMLLDLAKRVVIKKSHLLNPDEIEKHRKQKIETSFEALKRLYTVASELGNHSGESSLSLILQARTGASEFEAFFDVMRECVNDDIFEKLDCDYHFEYDLIDSQEKNIREQLDDIFLYTNDFGSLGGDKFIFLIPALAEAIPAKYTKAFFGIPTALVVDFGINDENDLLAYMPDEMRKGYIHPVVSKEDFIVGTNQVNWFFANGQNDGNEKVSTSFKEWKKRRPLLKQILVNVTKKDSASHYYIVDLLNKPKYDIEIYSMLANEIFGDEQKASERCEIISCVSNPDVIGKVCEWKEDTSVHTTILDKVTLADVLDYISDKIERNTINGHRPDHNEKIKFTEEEIINIREAGISLYGQEPSAANTAIWDFYLGSTITWDELAVNKDVRRDGYENFKNNIIKIIRNPKKFSIIYRLVHHPGAGGTTMVRRLVYDLIQLAAADETFKCLPVQLKSYNAKTLEYLSFLSEKKQENDFLLVVNDGDVSEENIQNLYLRMSSRKRNIIFLQLLRSTKDKLQGGQNVTALESSLSAEERKRFNEVYGQQSTNRKPLFTDDELTSKEVVDFPLKLKDDITSERLDAYVSEYMNTLTKEQQTLCGFVAFCKYYGSLPLNQNLVRSLYANESNNGIGILHTKMTKLILQETDSAGHLSGCWRPRYDSFCRPILRKVWGDKWQCRIAEISKSFLDECEKAGPIAEADRNLLYAIFILRRGSDYRDSMDHKPRFSLLIEDMLQSELRPESIFEQLVNIYPDDTVFLGHYGRYLFEKAHRQKASCDDDLYKYAENLINDALNINPSSDDIYHMRGMLYYRRIQSLRSEIEKKSEIDKVSRYDLDDKLREWVDLSVDSFTRSIELNPASPYGYTGLCNLYWECIETGKTIRKSDDYEFCDKEELYMKYMENFSDAISVLANICQAYDDNDKQSYMNEAIKICNRAQDHYQMVSGNLKGAVERYGKLYTRTNDKNKVYYGKRLIDAIILSRIEGKKGFGSGSARKFWAMRHLKPDERKRVSNVLQYLQAQSDTTSYEDIFWLKMSSYEEFPLDEAINLLQEWLNVYSDNNISGIGKLQVLFYLGVCYSALALKSSSFSSENVANAKKYFDAASILSTRFSRSDLEVHAYLGEEDDAHCILLPYQVAEAELVEAKISRIEGRKGWVKMKGLEAFFYPKGFDSLSDVNKTWLSGIIGFRYSGLGLYNYRTTDDKNITDEDSALPESGERGSLEDAESADKDKLDVDFGKQAALSHQGSNGGINIPHLKVLGKIDVSSTESNTKERWHHGIYHKPNHDTPYVISNETGYKSEVRQADDDELYDEDPVIYQVGFEPNKNNSAKRYYFAIHVKYKNEE